MHPQSRILPNVSARPMRRRDGTHFPHPYEVKRHCPRLLECAYRILQWYIVVGLMTGRNTFAVVNHPGAARAWPVRHRPAW
jgi:hypothetical protein